MKKHLTWKLLAILLTTLFLGFFDLPASIQQKIVPFTPETILKSKINLGLDLQGGSQLDYKIDVRNVPEKDRESIIDGVQNIIEKRVNKLGVSEPNIYSSVVADEAHIIVELADNGNIDQTDIDQYLGQNKVLADLTDDEKKKVGLEKAKAQVGKTIQLEFKEQKTTVDPQETEKARELAQKALDKIKAGADFGVTGQEEKQAAPGKVQYEQVDFIFESELPGYLKNQLAKLKNGEFSKELFESSGSFTIDETGTAVQDTSLNTVKLVETKEEVKNEKEVQISRILVAYQDAEKANATVTRNKDEAYKLAKEIKDKLAAGEKFEDLAKKYSDDSESAIEGGKMTTSVNNSGAYPYDFEKAALTLETKGQISEIITTPMGYDIIRADKILTNVKEKKYKYELISFSTKPDPWQSTGLTGKQFVHADVQLDNFFQPYIAIQFNEDGAKLFEEVTGRNVGKPLAMFVGGELISDPPPRVNEKIAGGKATITGQFTNEEAKAIARDLNTGAIPAPIVLTGEFTLGASLGKEALDQSLWAGLIGILLVMVFMILYYRVPGLVASAALIVYGVILIFLIKAQLNLGVAITVSLTIFLLLMSKIINTEDSGWEKFLSFVLTFFGFIFFTFVLRAGVVLTLAGVAGLIISFGMAVDANVLIFERIREELRAGNKLSTAIDIGFNRAWSAIRDSNFSSLITCAILFYFGSSIIRGFAFNLAAGILVSMFTAITITKILLYGFARTRVADNLKLLGVGEKKKELNFDFIGKSKIWFSASGIVFLTAILAIFTFGLNLGIDFKGGSLLALKFQEPATPVTQEQITTALEQVSTEAAKESAKTTTASATAETATNITPSTTDEKTLKTPEEEKLKLTSINILTSGKNEFIVKTNYLTPANHDQLLAKLKEKLPAFEETRFTTIGPTIGKTLLNKAIIAGLVSILMIVIYLYIAFRKIPKEVNPWRFGASAIVTLIHDVVIIMGIFAVLGKFLDVEMDALFATAMLTLFGYSVNDRIVIFDRLRETLTRSSLDNVKEIANKALNETLARSINTSISIALTMFAILFFGHASIFYFILALTLGVVIAGYTSVFIAAPLIVYWSTKKLQR